MAKFIATGQWECWKKFSIENFNHFCCSYDEICNYWNFLKWDCPIFFTFESPKGGTIPSKWASWQACKYIKVQCIWIFTKNLQSRKLPMLDFCFGPDCKISWWKFPRPRDIHLKPRYGTLRVNRTLVRTVLCLHLLLICHHFFYLLLYIKHII